MFTRPYPSEIFMEIDTAETSLYVRIEEFLSQPVTRQELLTIFLLGISFEVLISTVIPWLCGGGSSAPVPAPQTIPAPQTVESGCKQKRVQPRRRIKSTPVWNSHEKPKGKRDHPSVSPHRTQTPPTILEAQIQKHATWWERVELEMSQKGQPLERLRF
ncbi:hypothetical protein K440DRAFT_674254 [Wilcoxina mikolae CBS 423.85]|nr:hypothetical protein K440DRAFT_674254 [Wilcoxina mikolae CBS 423.85]